MSREPALATLRADGVTVHLDTALRERTGIVIAFSERTGGVSDPPFDSLNLASHVGDDPEAVDRNRSRLLSCLGLADLASSLVTAEQVHGTALLRVSGDDAGRGAYAASARPAVPATDALVTTVPDVPLMMLFADCVPVIVVAEEPVPAVGVAHAGWRGALGGIARTLVWAVGEASSAEPATLTAYIGPHIGPCCYDVDVTLLSQFSMTFGNICAVDGRLDLAAAVAADLHGAGVRPDAISTVRTCTRDHVDRFFSYRVQQRTGRHGALAAITKVG